MVLDFLLYNYLLNIYCAPNTVPGAKDTVRNSNKFPHGDHIFYIPKVLPSSLPPPSLAPSLSLFLSSL